MIDKKTLRHAAKNLRAKRAESATAEEPASAACHFFGGPLANWHGGGRKPMVAGYWPRGSEFDARPLLNYLHEAGHIVGLPVCIEEIKIMQFLRWSPDMRLQPDPLGIMAPPAPAETIAPDIVVVPLLAFTMKGDRLGYGAGYYDATLRALRSLRPIVAVGLGYAAQEIPENPAEPHDERLDWIVTEQFVHRVDTP